MTFRIYVNKNAILGSIDKEDESVSDAIYSTYKDYTYDIKMKWANNVIILDKKGDISEIYNDIIKMLCLIKCRNSMNFLISFLSGTFTAMWKISINQDDIEIFPRWITVGFVERENRVKEDEPIKVKIDYFLNEWNNLLRIIKKDMISVGYGNDLEGFDYLNTI